MRELVQVREAVNVVCHAGIGKNVRAILKVLVGNWGGPLFAVIVVAGRLPIGAYFVNPLDCSGYGTS